jgi:hypothetical protein
VKGRHRIIPTYVPPSDKRRDDLRLDVRNRMLACTEVTPKSKKAAPRNMYTPPTERRRDGLRWQVRMQMNE